MGWSWASTSHWIGSRPLVMSNLAIVMNTPVLMVMRHSLCLGCHHYSWITRWVLKRGWPWWHQCLSPGEWQIDGWPSCCCATTMISHSLRVLVKHWPRCGSVRLLWLHHDSAGPSSSASFMPRLDFCYHQLCLEFQTGGFTGCIAWYLLCIKSLLWVFMSP
jgi:hypothetical protein